MVFVHVHLSARALGRRQLGCGLLPRALGMVFVHVHLSARGLGRRQLGCDAGRIS